MQSLARRRFLVTSASGLAGILASRRAPAVAQVREISYLCWNNFAPASDKKLAEIGQRFTKDTGIKIKIDHIAAPQQPAKYASEIQTQAGHDLVEMRMYPPWLYEPQLVDVSDVVAELEKQYGPAIAPSRETAFVKGVWRAVPQYHTFFVATYREDLFKKAGLKIPDTWEDLYVVGKELKKMGNPIGIPISQNLDTISTAGPVLWSLGGKDVDKDGKVTINSPQGAEMVEWYKKMFRDCMEPEVLSWTEASNNESIQQGKASWIHNPVSAYIIARNKKLVTADGINHHKSLAGRNGERHETDAPRHIGIWKFSKNIAPAKEWIRYLLGKREVYDEYIMSGDAFNLPVYAKLQDHPVLKTDPKFAALKQEGVHFHAYGWPAPPSDKIQLITNSFIVPNMLAKAVTGTSTKDALAWAEAEMKKVMAG